MYPLRKLSHPCGIINNATNPDVKSGRGHQDFLGWAETLNLEPCLPLYALSAGRQARTCNLQPAT
ncbi:MAG: hypothetical protein U1C46_12155 [Bacteroidales bacterium]|nr:hypothetical protein [Bacteroidales bacterium]MDZ4205553.1 hypothetical protein [Bacteroidales bacterium]